MKELLLYMAKSLVDNPDQVQVNEGSSGVEKLASSFVKSFSAILSFLR